MLVVHPAWMRARVPTDWLDRYGVRFDAFRLPSDQAKRQAVAETIGADGVQLRTLLYDGATPDVLRHLPAVEILRRVWMQQYSVEGGQFHWRAESDLPPAEQLIGSPYDPDARYGIKRDTYWTGYTVHLTESCDGDGPNLMTHVATTPATTQDSDLTETIHRDLATRNVLPGEHLVDSGYVDSALVVPSPTARAIDLVGPVPPDPSWQARAGQGFDVSCFRIEWDTQRVTCPQGAISRYWTTVRDRSANALINVQFDRADCRACAVRERCTKAKTAPRTLTLRPQAHHEALHAARQRQTTAAFKQQDAQRAGVEGPISQGVHAFELRHSRYRGLLKTQLQHVIIAIAMNLTRLLAWWAERPRAQTRPSRFAAVLRTDPLPVMGCT